MPMSANSNADSANVPSRIRLKRRGAIESASAASSGLTSKIGCVRSTLASSVRIAGAAAAASPAVRAASVMTNSPASP